MNKIKTFTYKLQNHKKNKILHRKITVAGIIWNRLVRQQQRHRSIFYPVGKEPSQEVQAIFEKMRENKRYKGKAFSAYRVYHLLQRMRNTDSEFGKVLNELNAQSIQVMTERIQRAFNLFFTKLKQRKGKSGKGIEPVKTKKPYYYPSFAMKQNGYKFDFTNGKVALMGECYSFFKDIIPEEKIKTVTVKRDKDNSIYLYVVTGDENESYNLGSDRPIVGIDFWIDPIMTLSNGEKHEMPMFYREKIEELKALDRGLSSKREAKKAKEKEVGEKTRWSNKYKKLRLQRFRIYKSIANKRKEHHIQLARELAQRYSHIAVPDVPLHELARKKKHVRNGVSIGDIGYSSFVTWLSAMCDKFGSKLHKIPARSELVKTCSECGHVAEQKVLKKSWTCSECCVIHDRGLNTAKNLERIARTTSEQEK